VSGNNPEGGTAVSELAPEEIVVEENAQTERPNWLPSNFESPEMLAKSYEHSTKKITEQGQELAALRSQLDEIQMGQQQTVNTSEQERIEQELYDMYESGDGRQIAQANAYLIQQAMSPLAAKIEGIHDPSPAMTQITAKYARDQVAARYDDWEQTEPMVAEVIQGNPVLRQMIADPSNPEGVAQALDTAYKIAKFESGTAASQRAEQELAEINRQVKNQAQTMTGSNSSTETPSLFDQIKAAKGGIPSFRQ